MLHRRRQYYIEQIIYSILSNAPKCPRHDAIFSIVFDGFSFGSVVHEKQVSFSATFGLEKTGITNISPSLHRCFFMAQGIHFILFYNNCTPAIIINTKLRG
jgi:hypothetical protein